MNGEIKGENPRAAFMSGPSDQPAVLVVSSPTNKLLDGNGEHTHPAGNGNAHFEQILEHVFVAGGAGRSRQGKSMTYGPKSNDGAQRQGKNSEGSFEHGHLKHPRMGRADRL
jgi:hypothetical protein